MGVLIFIVFIVLVFSLYDYFDTKDWQTMTSAARNNVVFEERNKKYGAYAMRRDYNDLIINVIIGMFVFIGLFSVANVTFRSSKIVMLPEIKMDTTELTLMAPPIDPIETVKTPYEIVGGGGGSGTPSDAKFDPTPNKMVKKVEDTQEKSPIKVNSGQGNKTTGDNRKEEASTTQKSPFSGSGGKNGGDKGGLFGNDNGGGSGPGTGTGSGGGDGLGGNRQLIRKPNSLNIQSEENCKVTLNIKIDAEGNVIGTPIVDRDNTTTSSTDIINQVIALVKSEAKYSPLPSGSPVEKKKVTIQVKSN